MDTDQRIPQLLLVSLSPRRRRLLSWLGVPFEAEAVDTPEDLDTPMAADPSALAMHLAAEKALAARAAGLGQDELVLTFDTIVVHDGAVLGKPGDVEDARRMLRSLSGRTHQVVTGAATLCPGDSQPRTFAVVTNVTMRDLSDRHIEEWMAAGEFMGCAGAYNIEGQVAEVTLDECHQNVAGLPLCHLYAALTCDDAPVCAPAGLTSPIATCDAALGRSCRLGPRVIAGR
jgi:septum formation protein